MIVLGATATAKELAKALGKPVLYIYFGLDFEMEEIIKAAPYLSLREHGQAIIEGSAVIVCETAQERDLLYYQTVGEDGPTKLNSYNGPCKIFALTISEKGEFLHENT